MERSVDVFNSLVKSCCERSRKILQSVRKERSKQGFPREILEHVSVLLGLIGAEDERGNRPQSQEKKEAGLWEEQV